LSSRAFDGGRAGLPRASAACCEGAITSAITSDPEHADRRGPGSSLELRFDEQVVVRCERE
jgi:hypothetical protein